MADDGSFNSMQAQLGLVGGSGGFNPLGIATPAPPPPPPVRHPGDLSQDIVRQTQTAMATTLQTTSAMRLGGMGGVAFGGGGAAGGGIGATGAFAQQFQQNMIGINAQHVAPFSAQMMGQMGGMGGGFQPGMLPHPAMMTAPGMGIYRPFAQGPSPTVSPFPQMPMFAHPLAAMPPPPQFQTPMELSGNMAIQAGQRRTAAMFAMPGVAARAATDVGMGYMGAGVGAALGARFGPMGAAIGGTLGMAAGAFGSEHFGLGATAQHITERLNPFRTMAIRGQQMQAASQDWVTGGPDLNMMTGRGLSGRGATHLGRMLEDTAYSSRFRKETGGAFSAQDLTKITNVAGQQGLLQDTQSVDQIHDKVKGIAKSLVSFMKIANEPNVVEALKSMGRARAMGMSIGETVEMAHEARIYSKMAGQSVSGLMAGAGMQGAMTYQQQGLSAGLGMRMGMGTMGQAQAAVGAGAYTPQRLAMLGGVQGVAQRELESSAAFLKQPMLAAAVTKMGAGGTFKMDPKAIAGLLGGKMNIEQMATAGVTNVLQGVGSQGVGALAMAEMQAPEIQDAVGKLLGPGGMEIAQLNMITQQRKAFGFDKTPGGWLMAGRGMGYSAQDMSAKMGKVTSRGYWDTQQRALENRRMELRTFEKERMEKEHIGLGERMMSGGVGRGIKRAWGNVRNIGEAVTGFFQEDEEMSQARDRGLTMVRNPKELISSEEDLAAARDMGMTGAKAIRFVNQGLGGVKSFKGQQSLYQTGRGQNVGMSETLGDVKDFFGGSAENRLQNRRNDLGLGASILGLGGGRMESAIRMSPVGLLAQAAGVMKTGDQMREENRESNKAAEVYARGTRATSEEYQKMAGGKGEGISAELAQAMGALAKERSGTLGVGRSKVDLKASMDLAREIYKKQGKTVTEEQLMTDVAAATPQAIAYGGENAAEQFTFNKTTDVTATAQANQGFISKQEDLTKALYGEDTGNFLTKMGLGGAKKQQMQDVQHELFGGAGGGKAGMLASLILAAEGKSPDSNEAKAARDLTDALRKTDPKAVQRATDLVKKMRANGNADLAKQIGANVTSKLGTGSKELLAAGALFNKSDVAIKEVRRMQGGYKKLLGGELTDYEKEGKILSPREALEAAKGRKDLSEDMTAVMAEFEGAGTEEEKEAIAAKFGGIAEKISPVSEREVEGDPLARSEKLLDKLGFAQAEGQVETEKNFPNAVKTFSEASAALLEAANTLSGNASKEEDKTKLPSGAVTQEFD